MTNTIFSHVAPPYTRWPLSEQPIGVAVGELPWRRPSPTEPLPTHCPQCTHELWNAWAETDTIVGGLCMVCGITYYGVAT